MGGLIKSIIKKIVRGNMWRAAKAPYILPQSYRSRLAIYEEVELKKHVQDKNSNQALLRKCAHILEKGLLRPDWEPGHGKALYREALALFDTLKNDATESYKWAGRILEEYAKREDGRGSNSFRGVTQCGSSVGSAEAMSFFSSRTSCRQYTERHVDKKTVIEIVQAANHAPSSCNRHTLYVWATVDPVQAQSILHCFKGFTGFSQYVPCAIIFGADLRPYYFPNELFVPSVDVALAAENASLMATAEGLSATLLSWGSRDNGDEKKMRQFLSIPDYVEIVVGMACGYPATQTEKPMRKTVEETLIFF